MKQRRRMKAKADRMVTITRWFDTSEGMAGLHYKHGEFVGVTIKQTYVGLAETTQWLARGARQTVCGD